MRAGVNDLLLHDWFKNDESAGTDVSLQELLEMSVMGSKEGSFGIEKQLDQIIESLQVVISGHHGVERFPQNNVKELAAEFGVTSETLEKKLKVLVKGGENGINE